MTDLLFRNVTRRRALARRFVADLGCNIASGKFERALPAADGPWPTPPEVKGGAELTRVVRALLEVAHQEGQIAGAAFGGWDATLELARIADELRSGASTVTDAAGHRLLPETVDYLVALLQAIFPNPDNEDATNAGRASRGALAEPRSNVQPQRPAESHPAELHDQAPAGARSGASFSTRETT